MDSRLRGIAPDYVITEIRMPQAVSAWRRSQPFARL
jgi:hypothetical protein